MQILYGAPLQDNRLHPSRRRGTRECGPWTSDAAAWIRLGWDRLCFAFHHVSCKDALKGSTTCWWVDGQTGTTSPSFKIWGWREGKKAFVLSSSKVGHPSSLRPSLRDGRTHGSQYDSSDLANGKVERCYDCGVNILHGVSQLCPCCRMLMLLCNAHSIALGSNSQCSSCLFLLCACSLRTCTRQGPCRPCHQTNALPT